MSTPSIQRTIQSYIPDLIAFRHDLHKHPEVSNEEANTAQRVKDFLAPYQPSRVLEGLGGHGLAYCYEGKEPGPTIMLRCELDALPITEINTFAYRSTNDDVSHKCGHDGHMSILAGVARLLHEHPIQKGQVILLFQPAEETGEGARRVLQDESFLDIKPDFVFALHNLPNYPEGHIIFRPGPMACASRGLRIKIHGKTSHAAWPEDGKNPALPMCRIIEGLTLLPAAPSLQHCFNNVSVVKAQLGCEGFGTIPGEAEVAATLRSDSEEAILFLIDQSTLLIEQWLAIHGFEYHVTWSDIFALSENAPEACEILTNAAEKAGLPTHILEKPLRASEYFGLFTQQFPGALFGLGNGFQKPQLHNPDYDFPDQLIEKGINIFWSILQECLDVEPLE